MGAVKTMTRMSVRIGMSVRSQPESSENDDLLESGQQLVINRYF